MRCVQKGFNCFQTARVRGADFGAKTQEAMQALKDNHDACTNSSGNFVSKSRVYEVVVRVAAYFAIKPLVTHCGAFFQQFVNVSVTALEFCKLMNKLMSSCEVFFRLNFAKWSEGT